MDEILVKEYRGDVLECIHRGRICVVSSTGKVQYSVGDCNTFTFMRSTAKPIQAIPFMKHKVDEKFQLTERETAIVFASHRAEPFHVQALESMMQKVGLSESQLVCMPTYPLRAYAAEGMAWHRGQKRSIYHNCSGKHLGALSVCKALGYPTEDYCDPNHPLQMEMKETIAYLAEFPKDEIQVGIDGCGFPVYALPQKNLAVAYLKLACPDLIEDTSTRLAVQKIVRLMNNHYEMVAGTNCICSLLLQDTNIVAKGGAKGVYCLGLKKERLGISIKVSDGSEDEWPIIIASILEQLGYDNPDTIQRMYDLYPLTIQNDNQRIVGRNEIAFRLK